MIRHHTRYLTTPDSVYPIILHGKSISSHIVLSVETYPSHPQHTRHCTQPPVMSNADTSQPNDTNAPTAADIARSKLNFGRIQDKNKRNKASSQYRIRLEQDAVPMAMLNTSSFMKRPGEQSVEPTRIGGRQRGDVNDEVRAQVGQRPVVASQNALPPGSVPPRPIPPPQTYSCAF